MRIPLYGNLVTDFENKDITTTELIGECQRDVLDNLKTGNVINTVVTSIPRLTLFETIRTLLVASFLSVI